MYKRQLREIAPRLVEVVAIGESAEVLTRVFEGVVPTVVAASMKEAVEYAARAAQKSGGDVVLSPACASFDWYRNYNERGDDFKQIVFSLEREPTDP